MGNIDPAQAQIVINHRRLRRIALVVGSRWLLITLLVAFSIIGGARILARTINPPLPSPSVLAIVSTSSPPPLNDQDQGQSSEFNTCWQQTANINSWLKSAAGLALCLKNRFVASIWWQEINWNYLISVTNRFFVGAIMAVTAFSAGYQIWVKLFRMYHNLRHQLISRKKEQLGWHRFKVINSKSGQPIVGVRLYINAINGQLISKKFTDHDGQVVLSLPVGHYVLTLKAKGLTFTTTAPAFQASQSNIIYSGDTLHIEQADKPLIITIPMKSDNYEISRVRHIWLGAWQLVERFMHYIKWPIIIICAGLNTILLLWLPNWELLTAEAIYVVIVAVRVWLDVQILPSYGLIRDALSRIPLDLAVVRLYRAGSNQLIMTRVTDSQGKFFALPSSGEYNFVISKEGYADFIEQNVRLKNSYSSDVQIRVDLMPAVPDI